MKLIIDIGSNTTKCLFAKISKSAVEKFFEKSLECRISAGTGKLVDNTSSMIANAISQFISQAQALDSNFECIAVATSALRDSSKKDEIVESVFQKTGVHIKILSGEDEARLSFAGACSDTNLPILSKCAYFDLGGGSLEVVVGQNKTLSVAQSFKLGAVVLTEMFCRSYESISISEIDSIEKYVENVLADAAIEPSNVLIGAGGAVVAARLLNEKINNISSNRISVSQLKNFVEILAPMSVDERSSRFGIVKSRADILVPALICIIKLTQKLGVSEIYHTFNNLRYGVLLESYKQ